MTHENSKPFLLRKLDALTKRECNDERRTELLLERHSIEMEIEAEQNEDEA